MASAVPGDAADEDGYGQFGGVQYAPTPDQADRDIGAYYALQPVRMHPRTAAS